MPGKAYMYGILRKGSSCWLIRISRASIGDRDNVETWMLGVYIGGLEFVKTCISVVYIGNFVLFEIWLAEITIGCIGISSMLGVTGWSNIEVAIRLGSRAVMGMLSGGESYSIRVTMGSVCCVTKRFFSEVCGEGLGPVRRVTLKPFWVSESWCFWMKTWPPIGSDVSSPDGFRRLCTVLTGTGVLKINSRRKNVPKNESPTSQGALFILRKHVIYFFVYVPFATCQPTGESQL